jgi:hypothetical protein
MRRKIERKTGDMLRGWKEMVEKKRSYDEAKRRGQNLRYGQVKVQGEKGRKLGRE